MNQPTGGNDGDTQVVKPQASSPDANNDITFRLEEDTPSAGAEDQPSGAREAQDGAREPLIPRDRFDKALADRNAAAARATELEQRLAQQQYMTQQIVSRLQQPAPQPAGPTEMDQRREALRDQVRQTAQSPEEADRAFRLIDETARLASEEGDKALEERVMARTEQIVKQSMGSFAGAFRTDGEIRQMVSDGLIDQQNAQALHQQMQQVIAQDPAWGKPENQAVLLNNIYATMVRKGTVKPGSYQPQHQPGGAPFTPTSTQPARQTDRQRTAAHDQTLLAIQKAFPRRFGGLTLDQMRDINPSDNRGEAAPVQSSRYGDIPARVAHDHYVHHRPEPK